MTIEDVARRFTELSEDRPGLYEKMAATVLAFQRSNSRVYSRYCNTADLTGNTSSIPYLPVEAFKRAPVTSFPPEEAPAVFESSGTGRGTPSRHYVRDVRIYERAVAAHFARVFGEEPVVLLGHLPGYAERGSRSSLLYMVEFLISRFGAPGSGLFLDDDRLLREAIRKSGRTPYRIVLFGAAFGLLDLADRGTFRLPENALVVETGGMKTYRRELSRLELHELLARGFGLETDQVWSEYGMCELMSQCYTRGGHVFFPPPWMGIRIVDPLTPQRELPEDRAGALAVFDLANMFTVSAIVTEDRAVRRGDGFEVLGRLSNAELRGCNFLLEDARP